MRVIFFSLLYVNDLHRTLSSRLLKFVADWFEFSLVPDRDAEWRCGLYAFWRHAAKNILGNKRFSDNETHHGRILQGTGTFDVLRSIGTFFALLALCEGNHRSPMDSSHRGSTMQTFDDFFAQTRCWKNGHFTWLASRAPHPFNGSLRVVVHRILYDGFRGVNSDPGSVLEWPVI